MTNNRRKRAIVVEKNGYPIAAPRDLLNVLEREGIMFID